MSQCLWWCCQIWGRLVCWARRHHLCYKTLSIVLRSKLKIQIKWYHNRFSMTVWRHGPYTNTRQDLKSKVRISLLVSCSVGCRQCVCVCVWEPRSNWQCTLSPNLSPLQMMVNHTIALKQSCGMDTGWLTSTNICPCTGDVANRVLLQMLSKHSSKLPPQIPTFWNHPSTSPWSNSRKALSAYKHYWCLCTFPAGIKTMMNTKSASPP